MEEEEADSFIVISFDIEEDDDQVNMVYSEFFLPRNGNPTSIVPKNKNQKTGYVSGLF